VDSVPHVYRYARASEVRRDREGVRVSLSTSLGAEAEAGLFVDGRLGAPERVSRALVAVADVVRARFFLPRATGARLDPLVSAEPGVLRMEGVSSCASVYARLDLGEEALAGSIAPKAARSVDFDPRLRATLLRVQARQEVALQVGPGAATGEPLRRSVKLPLGWVRGFGGAAALQRRLLRAFAITGDEARGFLRRLPRGMGPIGAYRIEASGHGLRLTRRAGADTLALDGLDRVRSIGPVLHGEDRVVVWRDDEGASAWTVEAPGWRFTLLLSPSRDRGLGDEAPGPRAGGFDLVAGAPYERELPFDAVPAPDAGRA
jgi:hypothetical protein